jgi:hypothetical protein
MTRLAGLIALAAHREGRGDAQAQNCRIVGGRAVCAAPTVTYAAPSYNYVPHVVVRNVVVQQDYFVEPQVVEVVEIHKGAAAKVFGVQQYGHYAYYPDQVAVIREVVRRKVVVIEEEPETPRK